MKQLFVVYHELYLYSGTLKTRNYFRAKDYATLINYLSRVSFGGHGIITKIKRLKRIYRKTDNIQEVV